jgi:hypothetical protein
LCGWGEEEKEEFIERFTVVAWRVRFVLSPPGKPAVSS